ncbi:MAG: zinc ribbon domain-containing protein [Clostridia bacterium]|nr:zinc ribbon domain-containing protein [Clostridia bacterium]
MECKFCGRELEDDAVYCFYCGKRLDGKRPCPSCHAVMPEEAVFCGKCGSRLDPEILEEEPEEPAKPEENEQPEEEVAEQPEEVEEVEPSEEAEEEKESEVSEKSEQTEQTEQPEQPEAHAHNAVWRKAVEITKICLAGLAALVGFVFTFCIGVSINAGDGYNLSIFDYFGKVYENLDSIIVSQDLGDTQSFALYMPYLFGTLITVAALICNLVFTIMTVIAVVRQYAYKNAKVNFIKPALKTFISFAIFAALFFALNASSSHTLEGVNASVYFNNVTLAALIIGGVFFGGYFACNAVLRMTDFTNKKEIISSSVALGTGIVGIVIATLLTLTVCRFATATGNYSLGFMPMIGQASELHDGTNCGGVMCFGIPGFAVQTALLVLNVCVIVPVSVRIGSGNFPAKKPIGVAIAAAILSVLYFLAAFATASMFNSEIVLENTISRSYGVPISVIVLSFLMLGGVIACIVLDKKYKPQPAAK